MKMSKMMMNKHFACREAVHMVDSEVNQEGHSQHHQGQIPQDDSEVALAQTGTKEVKEVYAIPVFPINIINMIVIKRQPTTSRE